MFGWIKTRLAQRIVNKYLSAGMLFGDDVSYIFIGECVGFDWHHAKWAKLEKAYARLGYRTISIDKFIAAGGYGEDISQLIQVPHKPDEAPIFHAEIYAQHYLGESLTTVDEVNQDMIKGTYVLPSTEAKHDETTETTG